MRTACAFALLLAWLTLCLWAWRRRLPQVRGEQAQLGGDGGDGGVLVAYASQGGTAAALARASAEHLRAAQGGDGVRLLPLNRVTGELLRETRRAFFVASTYGEGEPPDNALGFARRCLADGAADLSHLEYAVLALGDSAYRNFCAFGHRLHQGLEKRGARALGPPLEVDGQRPPAADSLLSGWLHPWGEAGEAAAPHAGPVEWRLLAREQLNPGGAGNPLFLLRLRAVGSMPEWRAGDILAVHPHNDIQQPVRDYSIASVPAEGELMLLVRLQYRAGGEPGLGSGWLTRGLRPGERVLGRIRANPGFHGVAPERPLVLIGAGSGLAGLRAHLAERAGAGGGDNWLVYGERSRGDRPLGAELESWRRGGLLTRMDLVFSREGGPERYVQDALAAREAELRRWVARGAALFLCGNRAGMGLGVHQELERILGAERLQQMLEEGDYRRDLY